jgi:hypothetical protein
MAKQAYAVWKEDGAYFGECSECGKSLCVNIGRQHFFICPTHRIVWHNGDNVMSGWKYQSRQDFINAAKSLEGYTEVEFNEEKVLGLFDVQGAIKYIEEEYKDPSWDKVTAEASAIDKQIERYKLAHGTGDPLTEQDALEQLNKLDPEDKVSSRLLAEADKKVPWCSLVMEPAVSK